MECPECMNPQHQVLRTLKKEEDGMIERVRQCINCGHPWLTVEMPKEMLDKLEENKNE